MTNQSLIANNDAYLAFEKKIGFEFTNKALLQNVFIHRSYINETQDKNLENNERLEFLGDAVLELVVTEHLYKTYHDPEGVLTNWRSAIVRGEVLARVAKELGLGDLLFLSRGEEKSGGRERTLLMANTFEALIGAIYLDAGYIEASNFIHTNLVVLLPDIIHQRLYIDSKSDLQEKAQNVAAATPEYRVLNEKGPDHNKIFTVGVYVRGEEIAQGSGSSKQKAEQEAATAALRTWKKLH